jgi:hypothetical protein
VKKGNGERGGKRERRGIGGRGKGRMRVAYSTKGIEQKGGKGYKKNSLGGKGKAGKKEGKEEEEGMKV